MAKKAVKQEYPVCVRHMKPRKDVKLRLFFLCENCVNLWTEEAFANNPPVSSGYPTEGYCLLCNQQKHVQLYSWFLCDICDRVARSIGRNHVAEQAILDYWHQTVLPEFSYLQIKQNDKSSLRPRRDTDIAGQGPLDFLITDDRSDKLVFGIENKTGRSAIRDMSQFQLDISDCDSLLYHIQELKIPAYIIHAQVLELWQPPTMGFQIKGLWWTDIFKMSENFSAIKMRRTEMRGAAYFKKAAFAPIETFLENLMDENAELSIVKEFSKRGVPMLYEKT